MAKTKNSHLNANDCRTMLWTEDLLYMLAEIEKPSALKNRISKARSGLRVIINHACGGP